MKKIVFLSIFRTVFKCYGIVNTVCTRYSEKWKNDVEFVIDREDFFLGGVRKEKKYIKKKKISL